MWGRGGVLRLWHQGGTIEGNNVISITDANHLKDRIISLICCILKTHSHRLCNNNITDVAQEMMLHMQYILPKGKMQSLLRTYRSKVEMPSCFCQKGNTRSQLLPKKWCNMG